MKLKEIASIRSGLVLARKQANRPTPYRHPLITLRAILPEGSIDTGQLDIYDAKEPLGEEYLTQPGDIIVRLTAPYTAVLIEPDTAGIVVSSNFIIIRANEQSVLPEYLSWYLNTQNIKTDIYSNATSNMLGAVKARYFSELELTLPSLMQQQSIARLNALARRETRLLQKLAEMKKQLYTYILEQTDITMKRGNDQ